MLPDLPTLVSRLLILPWLLPFLRGVMLVTPLVLIAREGETLAQSMLAGVWSVLFSLWALRSDPLGTEDDITGDMQVLLLSACKILLVSEQATPWLMPLLVTLGLAFCMHAFVSDESTELAKETRRPPLFATLGILVALAFQGFGSIAFTEGGAYGTSDNVILMIEAAISLTLVGQRSYYYAQLWCLLQMCSLPYFYQANEAQFNVQLVSIVLVMLVVIAATRPPTRDSVPFFGGIWTFLLSLVDLLYRLLTSPMLYKLAILLSYAVTVSTFHRRWHTTITTYPPEMQHLANKVMSIVDAVSPVYKITSQEDVQRIMYAAAPQLGMLRLTVYRLLRAVEAPLFNVAYGSSTTFTPLHHANSLVSFILGPTMAAIGIVCSVFPSGGGFARSRWFWLFCCFGCSFFLLTSQIFPSADAYLLAIVFPDSATDRDYTTEGEVAAIATVVMAGGPLLLSIVLDLHRTTGATSTRPASDTALQQHGNEIAHSVGATPKLKRSPSPPPSSDEKQRRQKPQPARSRLASRLTPPELDAVDARATDQPPASVSLRSRVWSEMAALVTAPSTLLLATAVIMLVAALGSGQSPITKFEPVKIKDASRWPWLQTTELDQLAPHLNSMVNILVDAFGPQARLIPLIAVALDIADGAVECIPCLCIPNPADYVMDGFNHVKGFFGGRRRRRLLAFDPSDPSRWFDESDTDKSGGSFFDPDNLCPNKPSRSCKNGINICVSTVLQPIMKVGKMLADLFGKGLDYAVRFLVKGIVQVIPVFGIMEDAFEHLAELFDFADLDFIDEFAHFDLPSISSIVPKIHVPAKFSPGARGITIMVVACFVIATVLALMGSLFSVLLVIGRVVLLNIAINFLCAVFVLIIAGYGLVGEIRVWGYTFDCEFNTTGVLLCSAPVILFLLAVFMFVSESVFTNGLRPELPSIAFSRTRTEAPVDINSNSKKPSVGSRVKYTPLAREREERQRDTSILRVQTVRL